MDRRWPLIGIAGLATAGKDAIARRLVERWGFARIGFADALKSEVQQNFRKTLLTAWQDSRDGGDVPTGSMDQDRLIDLLIESKPPVVRALLQEYGTEVRRQDDPDYWVNRWADAVLENPERRIVTPDMRFQNEADMVRRWGLLVKVVRPNNTGAGMHPSELGVAVWPDSTFDWVVQNDGTLPDLWAQVDEWVGRQYEGWR